MSDPRDTMPLPSSYLGDYLGQNFDEVKKYEIVLHQNGRSIYNVDQNERDFINSFQRRRMMQDMIGDAAAEDAFLVVGTGIANNFTITGGENAPGVPKHMYCGGYQVQANVLTTYNNHHVDLNESLGDVAPPVLTTPLVNRIDQVYLDVFKAEVTDVDDEFLIPNTQDNSLTNRERLISIVRVAEGGSTPATPFLDVGTGITHHYVHIATIQRFGGVDQINALDVVDVRRTFTYGTIANGGLGLTDPGGMQAAIDNTSGAVASGTRHVILGTDADQAHIDSGISFLENYFVNAPGTGPTYKSPDGTPRVLSNLDTGRMDIDGNPIALLSDVPLNLESMAVDAVGAGPLYKSPNGTQDILNYADDGRMEIAGNKIALLTDTLPTAGQVLLFGRVTSGGAIDLTKNDGSAAAFTVANPSSGVYDVNITGVTGNIIVVVTANSNDGGGGANRHGGLFGVTQTGVDVATFPANTGFRAVFQRLFHQTCGGCPYLDNGSWAIPFSFVVYQA